jgi:hypothetical protein
MDRKNVERDFEWALEKALQPELSSDCPSHCEGTGRAWFDCGTYESNLTLALVSGWIERRNDKGAWFCPQCASKIDGKRIKAQAKLVKVGV